jgi:hypothetical protein
VAHIPDHPLHHPGSLTAAMPGRTMVLAATVPAVVGEAAVGMAKHPDGAGACPALTSAVSRQRRCQFPAP